MQLSHRIVLITGIAALAVGAQAMPTGAFLRKPAYKTSDLIAAMRNDSVVADRYIRHFRLTRPQLIEYFSSLHLAKLDQGGAYQVYNVHNGVIASRVLNLKKGTLVFADATGRPILQQVCGNPMVWRIPPIAAEPIVSAPATGEVTTMVDESSAVAMAAPIAEPEVGPVPSVPPIEPPTITSRGNNNGLLLVPLLIGIGAATLIKKNDDCPPPVPEPATMTIMLGGVAAMAIKKRRKNKK